VPELWTLSRIERVRSFIRNLSPRGEFILVILVGFGPITILQLLGLIQSRRAGGSSGAEMSNVGLVAGIIGELAILAAVLGIGKLRGWSLATFGSRISWRDAGVGILLFVVTVVAMSGVGLLVQIIHPEQTSYSVAGIGLPVILLFSLINPILEEVLEAGYFIHSLKGFGMWPAVLTSALFRALFHWWQGINGLLLIFSMGFIFGLAYWRWRQLWPLVIAHALTVLYAAFYWSHHAA
jgi:membrane protease YdiL (CAAX protease family)